MRHDVRESGLLWAERLPSHWREGALRWLTTIFAGGTPDKERPEFWADGTIPWLNSGAVNSWAISEPSTYITEVGFTSSSAKWIEPGAVVMALAGQGKTKGTAARLLFKSTCNQSMCAISPGPDVEYRYLHHWLTANYQSIRNLGGGDQRDGLNLQMVGGIGIPVPLIDEQRQIADYLDAECARLDRLVELRQQQIEVMTGALLEKLRVKTAGLDTGSTTATGVDWMPEIASAWTAPRVSWIFATGSGTTPPSDVERFYDGGIPWVNTGDLRDAPIGETSKTVTAAALAEFSTLRLYRPGSLVVAMYGQGGTKGRVGLLEIEACVNQACCVLVPRGSVSTAWAAYWFRAHKPEIVELAVGSGQPNLNQELIRGLRIPIPSPNEQLARVAEMRRLDGTTSTAAAGMRSSIDLLRERKQAVITAAVTGEFDVSAASGRGA